MCVGGSIHRLNQNQPTHQPENTYRWRRLRSATACSSSRARARPCRGARYIIYIFWWMGLVVRDFGCASVIVCGCCLCISSIGDLVCVDVRRRHLLNRSQKPKRTHHPPPPKIKNTGVCLRGRARLPGQRRGVRRFGGAGSIRAHRAGRAAGAGAAGGWGRAIGKGWVDVRCV